MYSIKLYLLYLSQYDFSHSHNLELYVEYLLEYCSITLSVDRLESVVHKNSLGCSEVWLKETLLTKLSRWAGEEVGYV